MRKENAVICCYLQTERADCNLCLLGVREESGWEDEGTVCLGLFRDYCAVLF